MENIPIVDTSQSMNGIPLYNSIALGYLFRNIIISYLKINY